MDQKSASIKSSGFSLPALSLLCFGTLFLFGWTDILRASAIPRITGEFGISDSIISLQLFLSTLCAMCGVFLGGRLIEKIGFKPVLLLCYSLITVGCLLLQIAKAPHYLVVLAVYMLMYFGFGFIDSGINSLGGRIFITHTALLVNIMHFCYGSGGIFGSVLGGKFAAANFPWQSSYLLSAGVALALLLYTVFLKFPPLQNQPDEAHVHHKIFSKKLLLLAAVAGFCIVLQVIIGSWMVNLLVLGEGWTAQKGADYMMLFFIMFTLSRIFAGIFAEKIGYVRMVYIGFFGSLLLFSAGFFGRIYILLPLAGFFIGSGLPMVLSIAMKEYPVRNAPVISFIMGAGALMNMTLSQTVGLANDWIGIKNGIGIFILYAVIAIILLTFSRRELERVKG